jgi:hypothetical protein
MDSSGRRRGCPPSDRLEVSRRGFEFVGPAGSPVCTLGRLASAGSLKQATLSEVYRYGDLEYVLSAVHEQQMLRGQWTCGECGATCFCRSGSATTEQAILDARDSLAAHHRAEHHSDLPCALRPQ